MLEIWSKVMWSSAKSHSLKGQKVSLSLHPAQQKPEDS